MKEVNEAIQTYVEAVKTFNIPNQNINQLVFQQQIQQQIIAKQQEIINLQKQ